MPLQLPPQFGCSKPLSLSQFLGKLNSQRAIEEESLIEVAISLCAVDRLLGGDEDKKGPIEGMGEEKKVFIAWCVNVIIALKLFFIFNLLTGSRNFCQENTEERLVSLGHGIPCVQHDSSVGCRCGWSVWRSARVSHFRVGPHCFRWKLWRGVGASLQNKEHSSQLEVFLSRRAEAQRKGQTIDE